MGPADLKAKLEDIAEDNAYASHETVLKDIGYLNDEGVVPAKNYLHSAYGFDYKTSFKKRKGGPQKDKIEDDPVIRTIDYIFHTHDLKTTRKLKTITLQEQIRETDEGFPFEK